MAVCLAAALSATSAAEAQTRRVFEVRTPFQSIAVVDDEESRLRSLYADTEEFVQAILDLDHPEKLYLEYNRVSLLGAALHVGRVRSALFAGLGAGSLPGFFHRVLPGASVEAVEIDPAMIEVARTYFDFDPKVPVHVKDARDYLRTARKRYDLLFVDCYIGSDVPRHLTTVEFLRLARARLTAHGVFVANLQGAPLNPLFASMVETVRAVFPVVYLFTCGESSNVVVVATRDKRRLGESALVERARRFEALIGEETGLVAAAERQLYWFPPKPLPAVLRDHDRAAVRP